MSLTLNMVGGGSGGGISPNKATIHVTAILGSQIDISFGGSVVKTIPSNQAVPNSDGKTADYYYSTSTTGTYTVTATVGSISYSKTVSVSAMNQYDVSVKILIVYDQGNENTSVTGGIQRQKGIADSAYGLGTMTKNTDNIYVYAGDSQGVAAVTVNKINVTGYKTLCLYATDAGGSSGGPRLCFTNDSNGGITNGIANKQFTNTGLITLDISTVGTKTGYVSARCLGANHTWAKVTFTKIWVED